jgi:hypothetical protein
LQFLYPSEEDTRALLRFLVEKLASSRGANSHPSTSNRKHSGGTLVVPHRSQPLAIGMDKQKGIFVFGSKGFAGVRPQHVPSGKEAVEKQGGEEVGGGKEGGVEEAMEDLRVEDGGANEGRAEDAQVLALQVSICESVCKGVPSFQ